MSLPEWLYRDVPSDAAGWSVLIVFLVTIVWGVTSVAAAVALRDRVERAFWKTFRFWLGVFLIWCDGTFYGIVALDLLRTPDREDLWAILLTVSWGVVAVVAFLVWAREETEARPR